MTDIASRFPQVQGNPRAMAMLAGVMRDRGEYLDAFALGLAAVEQAPEDMEVRDSVLASLSRGVPKWHVPMLRDGPRNRSYKLALEKAIEPGMKVLEIGSGAGFLSLVAAKAGAEVITCEAHPMVAAAAATIAERNGFGDRIKVIPKLSSALEVGVDLPERADLLMSELFDDTLFGDGIVTYIADARERLLKPDAVVVPARAELRCALVTFSMPEKHRPLETVEGFDLSAFNILAPRPTQHLRCAKVDAQAVTETISALPLDFSGPSPFGETKQRILMRSQGGRIEGVAQWLRVDFGDGIVFENDPFLGPKSHWGSPVNPLPVPLDTAAGEMLALTIRRVDRELLMSVERV